MCIRDSNYSDEWVAEAERRGLCNLKSTVDPMPAFILHNNVDLFTRHHVFTPVEIHSRYEILLENYCKTIHIEALTLTDMVKKAIIPSVLALSLIHIYLAFAALLHAGLDGIQRQRKLPPPLDVNLYTADIHLLSDLTALPASLSEALVLARKSDFLRRAVGGAILDKYLAAKEQEADAFRSRCV